VLAHGICPVFCSLADLENTGSLTQLLQFQEKTSAKLLHRYCSFLKDTENTIHRLPGEKGGNRGWKCTIKTDISTEKITNMHMLITEHAFVSSRSPSIFIDIYCNCNFFFKTTDPGKCNPLVIQRPLIRDVSRDNLTHSPYCESLIF